ncbi:MAG: S8 family serine peptidase [Acidobacteriia bacterium]|nr:S8 family serine peptidase [Terriglobia bacterium]
MKQVFLVLFLVVFTAFAQTRSRLADYALILADPPVAQKTHSRVALRGPEAQADLQRIRNAQGGVLAELQRRKVQVTGAGQILVNAVFVTASRETAAQLRDIPGVAYVVPAPPLHMDLNRALDLENVPAAWSAVGGASNAGAGIKIGIIDSGLDLNHPGFKDPSVTPPPGFPKGDTNYTNSKVIVARSYVALDSAGYDPADPIATSHPDDYSPRDRVGHGTAIAMIAAGVQNTGPGGTIQGVAPKAFLGNYKIIGSPSINPFARLAAFQQALQDALTDGMDIVTFSLSEGDPAFYGPLDTGTSVCGHDGPCDLVVDAVENAVTNGMVVVVSAGNDGNIGKRIPTLNTIHSPGTAPSGITVGASVNSHIFFQAVHVNGSGVPSGLQNINALFGDGPHIAAPLSAPIRDVAQLGNDGLACSSLTGGSLTGAIALIQRGGVCSFTDKIVNAQNAGAIGVVLYQLSSQNTVFSTLGAQSTGIPAVMIGNSDGVALKSFLASNSGATVSLDPALTASEITPDTVWPASSRGPSPGIFAAAAATVIKPELVAVGANVYTATQKLDPNGDSYHASGYTSVTGTSYAVPMVAGAVALVKQKFGPGMTPAQLKSAVVNTASPSVSDEAGQASVNSAGAGKLNAGDAVNIAATLEPATMEFGVIGAGSLPISRALKITNVSSSAATFNFAVQPPNASVQITPSSLTLQPPGSQSGNSNTVTVTLAGTRPAPGSYEGFIVVTGAGPTLRVPYQYLVGSGTPTDVFPIGNGGFLGGTNDTDWELDLRVVDQFGVPVLGTPVIFGVVQGGGKVTGGDNQSFALGNAAAFVNLGPNQGDQIFTATVGGLTVQFNGFARVYPVITPNRVVDAASFQVGQGLAPGSYITIFGTALADATQVESTSSLPVALSDVSVSFDGGGLSLPGHIHFVSPGQINVQIPWEFQGQSSVAMKVTVSALPSSVYTVPLATYSPGVLEYNDNGHQSAVAQDISFNLISQANPAQRGKTIQVYMNGLGPVTNQPASGEPSPAQPLASTTVVPTATIGGLPAQVSFSGLTPGSVGLYQVNVTVPGAAPTGNQPLAISVNGINAKVSSIPVQ